MTLPARTFVLHDELNAKKLWSFLRNNWVSLAQQGKPLAVTVVEHKSKRSIDQNKRYWAILNAIESQVWINGKKFSNDVWHEFFRRKFIGSEETPDGHQIGISTTTLSIVEFSEYMERIEVYALTELMIEQF